MLRLGGFSPLSPTRVALPSIETLFSVCCFFQVLWAPERSAIDAMSFMWRRERGFRRIILVSSARTPAETLANKPSSL